MAVYHERIGSEWPGGSTSWNSKDALLYAVGVGAGHEDPKAELHFTTENSAGIDQQVLPTFGVTLGSGGGLGHFGDFPLSSILHAEQAITVHRPISTEGEAEVTCRLVDIQDKGKSAMIVSENLLTDKSTGEAVLTTRATIFARGEGGFGGERTPSEPWDAPERPADHVISYEIPENQALLYRLTGDRNPLHSDPKSAAQAGFEKPILHGLCTFGYTGRALLETLCDFDPKQFEHMSTRFAAPVVPGETLTVSIWQDGETAKFQSHVGDRLVLDRGEFRKRTP